MAKSKPEPTTRKLLVTISSDDEAMINKWRAQQTVEPPLAPSIVKLARAMAEAELARRKAA